MPYNITRVFLNDCLLVTHVRAPVTGVSSKLNSATGTPLVASMGANPAAGYTTDDVPTYTHRCGHTERAKFTGQCF